MSLSKLFIIPSLYALMISATFACHTHELTALEKEVYGHSITAENILFDTDFDLMSTQPTVVEDHGGILHTACSVPVSLNNSIGHNSSSLGDLGQARAQLGQDIVITDPAQWPFCIHGTVTSIYRNRKSPDFTITASGTLVGRSHVLTTAKTIYKFNGWCSWGWPNEVTFTPAARLDGQTPQPIKAIKLLINEKWDKCKATAPDIGMIVLQEAIGEQLGWAGLKYLPDANLEVSQLYAVGLSEATNDATPNLVMTSGSYAPPYEVITSYPDSSWSNPTIFRHDFMTNPLRDGGGVMVYDHTADQIKPYIIGIQTFKTDYGHLHVDLDLRDQGEHCERMTAVMLRQIVAWIGNDYHQKKQARTTYKNLKKQRNSYDAQALFDLAECYEFGRGTLKNPEKAFFLYSSILRIKDRPINLNYLIYKKFGEFHLHGIGIPSDLEFAIHYYRKAHTLKPDDSSVSTALGTAYYDKGQRFTKNGNTVKDLKYYQLAVTHGHTEAKGKVTELSIAVTLPAVINAPAF